MLSGERLTRSASLTNVADVARALGLDPYRLAEAVGLPTLALIEPDLKVPTSAVGALLEMAAERAGADDFGLRVAERRRFSNMGAVALIAREQPSLRRALEVMAQYQWMQSEAVSLTLEEAGEIAVARIHVDRGGRRRARQATELSVGAFCRNLKSLMGEAWRPQAVLFQHGAPKSLEVHRRLFGVTPSFDQSVDALVLARDDLDAPLAAADPVLALQVERYLSQLSAGRSRTAAEAVEELIVLLLPTGTCTAERTARHMGFDRRTLHRRLSVEGVTFAELFARKRRDCVLALIANPHRSLTAVCDLAGFASPSAFSHWFRNAFGCSPRTYRRRLGAKGLVASPMM